MSITAPSKYLVFVSTQCVESGETGDGPFSAVFDSQSEAATCFSEQVAASRRAIEKEIAMIADPANRLIFESPYVMYGVLIAIPAKEAHSSEAAIEWISEQLADDEDLSDNVLQFEGASFSSEGEQQEPLEELWSVWE